MSFRSLYLYTLALIFVLFSACTSSSGPDAGISGVWQRAGLQNVEIKSIQAGNDFILAGGRNGAFKLVTKNKDVWNYLGFEEDNLEVRDFVIFNEQRFMLTVWVYNRQPASVTFYESKDGGNTWNSVQTTLNGEVVNIGISHLEQASEDSQILYAYNSSIIQSKDGGHSWGSLFTGGVSRFLNVSDYHNEVIWTGGVNTVFSPYLAVSYNSGKTWLRLDKKVTNGTDATCFDAIVHPQDKNLVLVGMSNSIRKSADGGQTWETVFDKAGTYTLTHSARNPKTVYASGVNTSGTVFFATSSNFGDSWQMVEMEDSPAGIQVNDMVSIMVEGKEVLYLGTNKGVYSYMFEN